MVMVARLRRWAPDWLLLILAGKLVGTVLFLG